MLLKDLKSFPYKEQCILIYFYIQRFLFISSWFSFCFLLHTLLHGIIWVYIFISSHNEWIVPNRETLLVFIANVGINNPQNAELLFKKSLECLLRYLLHSKYSQKQKIIYEFSSSLSFIIIKQNICGYEGICYLLFQPF